MVLDPPHAAASEETRTVLLVDDEVLVRRVGRAALEYLGHKVVEASNGREALDQFGRHPGEIDLVILDQLMPDMDGAEAFLALRERAPDVTVLFACGDLKPEVERLLLAHGVAGFIQKPYTLEALRQCVSRALEARNARDA